MLVYLSMSEQLENRFLDYGKRVRDFCKKLNWDIINTQYIRQVIRCSSSIGANYMEAADDLGKADEKMKLKISRREAKETVFFLQLLIIENDKLLEIERSYLIDEGSQIRKILSAIINKL